MTAGRPAERPTDTPGMMFVLEGANGTGKTTAAAAVAGRLRALGADVVSTREPGGTPAAEALRRIVLDPSMPLDPHEQTMLLVAARRSHLREVIMPALERGAIVLCDRFVASTLVHQTLRPESGDPVSVDEVVRAHRDWCWGFAPHLQIDLAIDVDTAMGRRRSRDAGTPDRFESDDPEHERACIERYAESARLLGFRSVEVDATGSPSGVTEAILRVVRPAIEDGLRSVLVHRASRERGRGRWHPLLDARGRVEWTVEPHEAHRLAAAVQRDDPTAQTRIVPRRVAVEALRHAPMDVPATS